MQVKLVYGFGYQALCFDRGLMVLKVDKVFLKMVKTLIFSLTEFLNGSFKKMTYRLCFFLVLVDKILVLLDRTFGYVLSPLYCV